MNLTYIEIISYIAAIVLGLWTNFLITTWAISRKMGEFIEWKKQLDSANIITRLAWLEGQANGGSLTKGRH